MVHIFLTFGCLFDHDHVLSPNISFELSLGRISLEKVILDKNCSVQTAAVFNYSVLFSKK